MLQENSPSMPFDLRVSPSKPREKNLQNPNSKRIAAPDSNSKDPASIALLERLDSEPRDYKPKKHDSRGFIFHADPSLKDNFDPALNWNLKIVHATSQTFPDSPDTVDFMALPFIASYHGQQLVTAFTPKKLRNAEIFLTLVAQRLDTRLVRNAHAAIPSNLISFCLGQRKLDRPPKYLRLTDVSAFQNFAELSVWVLDVLKDLLALWWNGDMNPHGLLPLTLAMFYESGQSIDETMVFFGRAVTKNNEEFSDEIFLFRVIYDAVEKTMFISLQFTEEWYISYICNQPSHPKQGFIFALLNKLQGPLGCPAGALFQCDSIEPLSQVAISSKLPLNDTAFRLTLENLKGNPFSCSVVFSIPLSFCLLPQKKIHYIMWRTD